MGDISQRLTYVVRLMATEGGEFLRETQIPAVCKYEIESGLPRQVTRSYNLIVQRLYNIYLRA